MHDLLDRLECDESVRDATYAALLERYPMQTSHRLIHNITHALQSAWRRSILDGTARLIVGNSDRPQALAVHDVCTPYEANDIIASAQRLRQAWTRHVPNVCFQHAAYIRYPALAHAFAWTDATGRGCLTQDAAAHIFSRLPYSESIFIYRGQVPLLDAMAARIEARLGLADAHAHPWQVLIYGGDARTDEGYAAHLDCTPGPLMGEPGVRMATVLLYFTGGFDGGATEFLNHDVSSSRPPVGSALVFYNYGPGDHKTAQCNRAMLHRSEPSSGTPRIVLQRWYAYAEQPILAARTPRPVDVATTEAFRPVISCDYVGVSAEDLRNVSCRWYNTHSVW